MLKISSPSSAQLSEKINESIKMLVLRVNTIQEEAQAGVYSSVQKYLDMAAMELQYIDKMIEEHYKGDIPENTPTPSLYERTPPEINYLTNSPPGGAF